MSKQRATRKITIQAPDEFLELCDYDMTTPERVLRGFIADLCGIVNWASNPRADGYGSNGSDERDFARAYYDRVGYAYEAEYIREAKKAKGSNPTDNHSECIANCNPVDVAGISKRTTMERQMHRR